MRTKEQVVAEYGNLTKLNRIIVEKLIDHIIIGKRKKGEKHGPVEIHWNF